MNQRREDRFRASFPVEVEPEGGVLVDMSGSGIAFETNHEYRIGDPVSLRVMVGRGPRRMQLECTGRVVRIERREDSILVAATVEWQEDDGEKFTLI